MSELTRAQIDALMKRGSELIRKSQEIRRDLDAVLGRASETGRAEERPQGREATPKRKTPQ